MQGSINGGPTDKNAPYIISEKSEPIPGTINFKASEACITASVHIAPHHGCSFPFVLQDFGHLVRPPALVALAFGFHPVGAPVTRAAYSNCLAV